jgi:DHA2 family multidrug resistance protein
MTATQAPQPTLAGSKFLITISAMMASLMAVLDISIVNVAINDIRASFGVQLDQIAWISTGYMMANVIVIPLTGWFQKKYGLRDYFVFSVVLFTIASFLCGTAWNLISLTLFRILQGFGGGAIIPTSSTILMSRYPKEEQGMAQAFIGLGAITGPLFGPTLGGYLIDIASWHFIFLINIPVGIFVAIMGYRNIKETDFVPSKSPLDKKGVSLLVIGLACFQFVIEEGTRHDWFKDNLILFLSIISFVCLVTLVVQQLEEDHPMIDFRVFKDRNYILCSIINFLLGVTLFSGSFLFSLFCGAVLNYAPLDIGLLFFKGCFIQVIMMPIVGKFSSNMDGRYLTMIGIALVATSILLNAKLTQNAADTDLILVLFVRSLGLACVFIPLSVIAIDQIKRKDIGNAIGLFNLTRELGGSMGLAIMSSILVNHISMFKDYLRAHLNAGNFVLHNQLYIMKNFLYGKVTDPDKSANIFIQSKVNLQATVESFGFTFFHLSLIFFASMIIVFFLKKMYKHNRRVDIEFLH